VTSFFSEAKKQSSPSLGSSAGLDWYSVRR
jgi:hypothetical protein